MTLKLLNRLQSLREEKQMRQMPFLVTVVLGFALCMGCGQGISPLIPSDIMRSLEDFSSVQNLFVAGLNKLAWHVDLATLVVGPDPPPGIYEPGDVWNRSNFQDDIFNYCAGVSMVDDDISPGGAGVTGEVRCRWLMNGPDDYSQAIGPEWRVTQYAPCYLRWKFPRCDTMYFYSTVSPEDSIVELAVCYMVEGVEGGISKWDIGVSIDRWVDSWFTFPGAEPDRIDYRWDLPDTDEWHPDISYDPYTGDLYLVYTVASEPARVYYRRYDRATTTWSDQYPVHSDDHGGWTPRIDVGMIENIPSVVGIEDVVGVAYSAFGQGGHTNHFHPCVTYWGTDESDGEKGSLAISACNPAFPTTLHSGIPDICIGPNSNSEHIGALVYVQESTAEGEYCIYEIDSRLKNWCIVNNQGEIQPPNRFLPAISIHYQTGNDPPQASITAFYSFIGSVFAYEEVWRIDMSLPLNNPNKLSGYQTIQVPARGNWDALDILGINPGLSSSIVVRQDNGYWAGFCDRVEWIEPVTAGVPKVAFGRSN